MAGPWLVPSVEILEKNGWKRDGIKLVSPRDIAAIPIKGFIEEMNPAKYGPGAIKTRGH